MMHVALRHASQPWHVTHLAFDEQQIWHIEYTYHPGMSTAALALCIPADAPCAPCMCVDIASALNAGNYTFVASKVLANTPEYSVIWRWVRHVREIVASRER